MDVFTQTENVVFTEALGTNQNFASDTAYLNQMRMAA